MYKSELSVDIVVPVYNQRHLVLKCIESVLGAANTTPFEIVVIDDGSTDPDLTDWLQRASSSGSITLLKNETNIGFTQSVNRGMRLHLERDVLLLNSDVVVNGDWLDRLRSVAYSGKKNGTVNPLTNASHIGCYPFRIPDGSVKLEISDAELNALAAEANHGRRVRVQTTVGFCQYLRRDLLNSIGYFDSNHFPFGYGEEADFCYRAAKLGWQHWIAGDVFVRHWEGQSFGPGKAKLIADMLSVFVRLHPQLPFDDQEFARRDPIKPLREALDLVRLRRLLGSRAELPCYDNTQAFDTEEPAILFDTQTGGVQIAAPSQFLLPNLPHHILPHDISTFNRILLQLGVTELIFCNEQTAREFRAAVDGRPWEVGLAVKLKIRVNSGA